MRHALSAPDLSAPDLSAPALSALISALCALISALCALSAPPAHAQSCGEPRVAFTWTQPPRFPIEADESIRWPIDGGLRFAYTGDWCPSAEQVRFTDASGAEVPALITFLAPVQLVQNGPAPEVVGLLKPLMSLAERADYTLRLSPPNARLREYDDYEVTFKTRKDPMSPIEGFVGVGGVEVDGDLCEGAFVDIDAEDFSCVTPAHLRLKVSFRPLPLPEVTYAIYRTRTTPRDETGAIREREVDEVERLVGVVAGVTAERAERSISLSVPVLYAPLPREDCFRVAVLDEWGRERGDGGAERCVELTQPTEHCPPGCVPEEGNCVLIFPPAEPSTYNQPVEGAPCAHVGVHGADPRTPIPPLVEDAPEDMGAPPEPDMAPPPAAGGGDEGCAQRGGSSGAHALALALACLCALTRSRRYRAP